MFGVEKTTVKLIITLPEHVARVQRLYDYGIFFKLEEEIITDIEQITELLNGIKAKGGKLTKDWTFISDDDMTFHRGVVYECEC